MVALVALLCGVGLVASAFTREPPIASLGGEKIREADFQSYLESTLPPEEVVKLNQNQADRERALSDYLDTRAILAKATALGITSDEHYKKAVELMEVRSLARMMTERARASILQNSEVRPDEVRAYYEQHRSQFMEEPRFTAHQLVVYVKGNPAFPEKGLLDQLARIRAEEALSQLRQGKSWEEVVKLYSDEGKNRKGGLIRDGKFGYFAKGLEEAVRSQELGKPGRVFRTEFGYHVVEVKERHTEIESKPFEQVKELCASRISEAKSREARRLFMTPISKAVGFQLAEAGKRDVSLLDPKAVAPEEVLAVIGGTKILERDFQWFLRDALLPSQRKSAYNRPGTRLGMLSSYLDMLVLAQQARAEGLHKTPEYLRTHTTLKNNLTAEFLQQRDHVNLRTQGVDSEEERQRALRKYLDQTRADVKLRVASRSAE